MFDSLQMQAFICTTVDNDVAIGVSTEMRLDPFAQVLQSQLHCLNALRLTGYSTAGLFFSERKLVGNDDHPLASVIGIFE